jgi:hypothetical protein
MNNIMKTTTETQLKCPFCHEGTMRKDSCGCLTCWKCHRVEGTNCNINACQNARFSTSGGGNKKNVPNQMC